MRPQRQGPSEQGERPRFSIDPREPIGRSFVSREILQNGCCQVSC